MAHINNGSCSKCLEIINRFPNFNPQLLSWFEEFQKMNPDAHTSCAGRGKLDQELDFQNGVSKAHYGESAHNYNNALDFFRLTQAGGAQFDRTWFTSVLAPAAKSAGFVWGGDFNSIKDFPHVEIPNFKSGKLVQ